MRKRLTPEQEKEAVKLYTTTALSQSAIGKRLNVSRKIVCSAIQRVVKENQSKVTHVQN